MTVPLLQLPRPLAVDANGVPRAGAKLYVFAAGTSTPVTVYQDAALTIIHASPIVANSDGLFPPIYADPSTGDLKINLTTAADIQVAGYPIDNIPVKLSAGAVTLDSDDVASALDSLKITAAEIAVGVTPTNLSYDPCDVRRYGGDPTGVADSTAALVTAIKVAYLAKGAAFIGIGCNYLISSPLDTLVGSIAIRIRGEVNCQKQQQIHETGVGLPTITCNNCALIGTFNKATNTLTWTNNGPSSTIGQCLELFENVRLVGSGGAAAGIVGAFYGANIAKGCHIENFSDFGIITVGFSLSKIGPVSTCDCGSGRAASGTMGTDGFLDGCAILVVPPAVAIVSGAAGNLLLGQQNYAGIYSEGDIDLWPALTTASTTSFKGFVGYGLNSMRLRIDGFGGVYAAYGSIFLPSPHLEVYSSGGAVAADGKPYCLVTFNCAATVIKPFIQTTPVGSNNPIAFIRNSNFYFYNQFYDYVDKTAITVANISQFMFGEFRPDSVSTTSYLSVTEGSAANPLAYFDTTLNALLVSAGSHFYPLVAMPLFQSGTLATGSNVTTTDPPTSNWSTGGGTAHAFSGAEYEVSVFARNATGQVVHSSVWRMVLGGATSIVYNLAQANPIAGLAVTASGVYKLNLANTSGANVLWRVQFKLMGPAVEAPVN